MLINVWSNRLSSYHNEIMILTALRIVTTLSLVFQYLAKLNSKTFTLPNFFSVLGFLDVSFLGNGTNLLCNFCTIFHNLQNYGI